MAFQETSRITTAGRNYSRSILSFKPHYASILIARNLKSPEKLWQRIQSRIETSGQLRIDDNSESFEKRLRVL